MAHQIKHLYQQFCPEKYDLEIVPNETNTSFTGSVVIEGRKVGRPNKRMVFHQHGLHISEASLVSIGKNEGRVIPTLRIYHHAKYDEIRIHTAETLYPGKYVITLKFAGKISESLSGLFPCPYKSDGAKRTIMATQFESHHAREVFPCIDEPEAKAVFNLSVITPPESVIISNAAIKDEELGHERKKTVFEPTLKMSTYLLAFVYGDLRKIEATTKNGVLVAIWSRPELSGDLEYALQEAIKLLEFYEEYFGVQYPLSKCDLVAVPQFGASAMENWGCITFRERAICVSPIGSSLSQRQLVTTVIAHELAHQWFGNLVTMKWWDDLWLNEGFGRWMESFAVDGIHPEWNMWEQFSANVRLSAMRSDALLNTHPIEMKIGQPDEINGVFDAISYDKGASLIHMLRDYLGADVFRRGLHLYLTKHSYSNSTTADLWAAMGSVSGIDVDKFMASWTSTPGYPIVSSTFHDGIAVFRQERFYINTPAIRTNQRALWPIPIQIEANSVPTLFDEHVMTLPYTKSTPELFRTNPARFVRIANDSSQLASFCGLLLSDQVSGVDKIGLLCDLTETSKAGQFDTLSMLSVINNTGTIANSNIWKVTLEYLDALKSAMDDHPISKLCDEFVSKIIDTQLNRLGWDVLVDEPPSDSLLRPLILDAAGTAGHQATISEAIKRFDNLEASGSIPTDLQDVIYKAVSSTRSDQKTFDTLMAKYASTNSDEERIHLIKGVSAFKDPALVAQALDVAFSDSVNLQDVFYWIVHALANPYSRLAAWDMIDKKWAWLCKNLGTTTGHNNLPIYVARNFSDKNFLEDYQRFFEPRLNPGMQRSYAQGLEILQWRSEWKRRDYKIISSYLKTAVVPS